MPLLAAAAHNLEATSVTPAGKDDLLNSRLRLKPVTMTALDVVRHDYAAPVKTLHIYTDGACHDDGRAGYAIVLVAQSQTMQSRSPRCAGRWSQPSALTLQLRSPSTPTAPSQWPPSVGGQP